VLVLVKPATVIQWHRQGFRKYWRWRSSSRRVGRPGVNREISDLIRQMSVANPFWGAPRIHDEMLKLGIEVSQATVGRHMVQRHALTNLADLRLEGGADALVFMSNGGMSGGTVEEFP